MDGTDLLQGTGALLPHLTVITTGLVILVLDLFLTARSRYVNEVVGLIGLVLAFALALGQAGVPLAVLACAAARPPHPAAGSHVHGRQTATPWKNPGGFRVRTHRRAGSSRPRRKPSP